MLTHSHTLPRYVFLACVLYVCEIAQCLPPSLLRSCVRGELRSSRESRNRTARGARARGPSAASMHSQLCTAHSNWETREGTRTATEVGFVNHETSMSTWPNRADCREQQWMG